MRSTWSFATAGQLVFGRGAARQLGELVRRRRIDRVVIVTDRRLVDAGIVRTVEEALVQAKVRPSTFSEGEPEPSLKALENAWSYARECQPQAIVGLGGGSNMDLAKLVANLCAHGGQPQDYFGFDRIPGPVLPLICIPTTSGTGSEVSHAAVVTDTANQIKVSTLSHYLRPTLAVVDPELTYSCPRHVTADSGIDALTHAIEAYTATDFDQLPVPPGEACAYEGRYELGDCLAEKAIALIGQHLASACNSPQNSAARQGMALAATLAGMAFSNCGVALVHALEYPVGGAVHCSHGAGNGLLLPYVMRFNLPERQPALARIAALLGCPVEGKTEFEAAELAIAAVESLRQKIGIPERLRDLGVRREQLPQFAEKSFAIKRLLWVNPRRASQADLLGILEAAW